MFEQRAFHASSLLPTEAAAHRALHLGGRSRGVADDERRFLDGTVRSTPARVDREQRLRSRAREHGAIRRDAELIAAGRERARVLLPRKTEHVGPVGCEVTLGGARVVGKVAAQLEPRVRFLRIGGNDAGGFGEVRRAARDQREPLGEPEVAEVAVQRMDARGELVHRDVLGQQAKRDVLRLDAGQLRRLGQAREHEQADAADAGAEIERVRDARRLLERVPRCEDVVGRVAVTVLALEQLPPRGKTVERDGLAELGLERRAPGLGCHFLRPASNFVNAIFAESFGSCDSERASANASWSGDVPCASIIAVWPVVLSSSAPRAIVREPSLLISATSRATTGGSLLSTTSAGASRMISSGGSSFI